MKYSVSAVTSAVLTCLALSAAPAQAQSRVFVAAQGSDTNPCTFGAPCRTFQHAHDVVAAGGEIDVLDPGGYGALQITKAISIQGHGFSGISVASGSTGITVAAGANDAVHLNGVLIDGVGTGMFGITFQGGRSLTIENCVVRNHAHSGLGVGSNGANSLVLTISNSFFADNTFNGILLQSNGSGAVAASIDRTVVSGNRFAGLNLIGGDSTGGVKAMVTDSVAANNRNGSNAGTGFLTQSTLNHSSTILVLTRVTAVGNGFGISSNGPNSAAVVGQSSVTNNDNGWSAAGGGAVFSYGDNAITDNVGNTGPLSPTSRM